jgi:hypothetical protein
MRDILKIYFTQYYNTKLKQEDLDFIQKISDSYFEIKDDLNKNTIICKNKDEGVAKFLNKKKYEITIISYDKFLSNLEDSFQYGKKRCDLIMTYIDNIILGELKDTKNEKNYRKKAKKQLSESLNLLIKVPEFKDFVSKMKNKLCC